MSKGTLQHLNTNTLTGFTEHRGHAWHYRAEEQGAEPNHYPGAIPIEDVQRRLFAWTAESRRVAVELPADVDSMTQVHGAQARSALGAPGHEAVQIEYAGHSVVLTESPVLRHPLAPKARIPLQNNRFRTFGEGGSVQVVAH